MELGTHYALGITPKSRAKLTRSGGSLSTPTVIRRLFWCNSYFMLIGVDVSCYISYSIVVSY